MGFSARNLSGRFPQLGNQAALLSFQVLVKVDGDGGDGGLKGERVKEKQRPIKIHGPFELLSLGRQSFDTGVLMTPRKGYSGVEERGELVTALTHPRNSLPFFLSLLSSYPPPFFSPSRCTAYTLSSTLPSWRSANSLFLIIVRVRDLCLLRAGEYAMVLLPLLIRGTRHSNEEKKTHRRNVNDREEITNDILDPRIGEIITKNPQYNVISPRYKGKGFSFRGSARKQNW